jgi:hypothetical protein
LRTEHALGCIPITRQGSGQSAANSVANPVDFSCSRLFLYCTLYTT